MIQSRVEIVIPMSCTKPEKLIESLPIWMVSTEPLCHFPNAPVAYPFCFKSSAIVILISHDFMASSKPMHTGSEVITTANRLAQSYTYWADIKTIESRPPAKRSCTGVLIVTAA